MKIRVCSSVFVPSVVMAASSDGRQEYEVVTPTLLNGGICSCKGYEYRGTCRHLREITPTICTWWTEDLDVTECPLCHKEVRTVDYGD